MNQSRRDFTRSIVGAPLALAAVSATARAQSVWSNDPKDPYYDPYWWQKTPPPSNFKPVGVDRSKVLKVYSGRTRPDMTPVYALWEATTGILIDLEVIPHQKLMARLLAEKNDPQADVMLTNTIAQPESVRERGVFEPYRTAVAQEGPDWLRAPDYSWMSFSAWPRSGMINWNTMGRDRSKYPTRTEDLCEPEFRDKVSFASIHEGLMSSHIAALRVAKGDAWTEKLLTRLIDNGMHIYPSHIEARYAMLREGYKVSIANSSNNTTFFFWGNPVSEAWLDQGPNDPGTYVGAHSLAVTKGGRRPDVARQFVDFLLSKEIQELLARLYGETPVNPAADTGPWVRPLAKIKRIEATQKQVGAIFDDTVEFLAKRGFDLRDTFDPYTKIWRGKRVKDKIPPNARLIF